MDFLETKILEFVEKPTATIFELYYALYYLLFII
jgi:hypothetical protein